MNLQRISLAILVLLIFGPISVCSRTAGLAITEPAPAKISKEKSQPNIVLFLVDDLGWQDSSVSFWTRNTEFQAHYHTPNVAKLAEQGVRFTNAYSHCVCSPTRTSIMTGQNPARHHVTNWTLYADRDQSGKTNRVAAPAGWRKSGIQTHDITLARKLKAVGYTTIHCGKAHWGAYDTPGSDPRNLGFDINIAGHAAGGPGSYQAMDNFGNQSNGSHRRPWGIPGLKKYHGTNTHLTDALATEACIAIKDAARNGPFFLYMAPYAVHAPLQPHGRFIGNYRGKKYSSSGIEIPEAEACYASMVEGYDAALGAILKQIDDLKIGEETIVVFASDNGGLTAHARATSPRGTGLNTHCWPLREGKGSAYDGGTRVPLIASWARTNDDNDLQQRIPIEPGSISKAHVICDDLMPTICTWAGNPVRSTDEHVYDGNDISRYFVDDSNGQNRELLFHYPHVWGPRGPGYQPHSALRLGNWKVIYFYHARRWELYDVVADIGETRNLAYAEPAQLAQMANRLIAALIRCGAQYPVDRNTSKPIQPEFVPLTASITPVPSSESRASAAGWTSGGRWMDQHSDINRIAKQGKSNLVFLGDSITQSWGGAGRKVASVAAELWDHYYGHRRAANFGISGDRTQHVLWRIQNGNFKNVRPKLVVLMIGTNNLATDTADDIAAGIHQIVFQIEERRDGCKILLLGILPRGRTKNDPLRIKLNDVNKKIMALQDNRRCFFLDIGSAFLDSNGSLVPELYRPDHLHLTKDGYRTWADSIESRVASLMGESNSESGGSRK